MATGVQQLARRLIKDGLLSEEEIRSHWYALPRESRPRSAEELAQNLVAAGKLTGFQASALLTGKVKRLGLGNYVILDEIGAGGMGQVFLAWHRVMNRRVALKTIAEAKVESEEAIKRFCQEVEVAAQLDHPNIVTAYDAGEANGIYFLTMQYIRGRDLASLVRTEGSLPVELAVDYACQAAEGLSYAHGQGIIHRDIKPSNLLLDESGTVKILDMGLARLTAGALTGDISGSDEGGNPQLTHSGQVMGTPDFISPEQAKGTLRADRRSDVYSLGCTLFFLLAGRPPYPSEALLEALLAHQSAEIPSLRDVRGDVSQALDAVVRKMLAKDPDRRQQSMREVIDELQQAVAFDDTGGGHAAALDPELHDFLKTLPKQKVVTPEESPVLTREGTESSSNTGTIVRDDRKYSTSRVRYPYRIRTYVFALTALAIVAVAAFLPLPNGAPPAAVPPDSPSLPFRIAGRELLAPRTGIALSVALSASGRWLATGEGSVLRIWDVEQGWGTPPHLGHGGMINSVGFAPDERSVATASDDGSVRLWDLRTGRSRNLQVGSTSRSVRFSPLGNWLAAGFDNGTAMLWELPRAGNPEVLAGHTRTVSAIAFTSDEETVATGGSNRGIRIWDLMTRRERGALRGHTQPINSLFFLQNNSRLISSAGGDRLGEVILWDAVYLERLETVVQRDYAIRAIDVAEQYGKLAIGAGDGDWGHVAVIDLETRTEHPILPDYPFEVLDVALAKKQQKLAASLADHSVKVWDLSTGQEQATFTGHCELTHCLAFSPDGSILASGGSAGVVKLWNPQGGSELATLRTAHAGDILAIAFAPHGQQFATGGVDGRIVLWDLATKAPQKSMRQDQALPVRSLAFSPAGDRLLAGGGDVQTADLCLWNLETGEFDRKLIGHGQAVTSAAFSPDGKSIVSGSQDATVQHWHAQTGASWEVFRGHVHSIWSVCISPDGSTIASASRNGSIVLRDVTSGRQQTLVGHNDPVRQIAFLAGGNYLLSASDDGTLRVWDIDTGREAQRLNEPRARAVLALAVSQDNTAVALASSDGSIQLLDLSRGGSR